MLLLTIYLATNSAKLQDFSARLQGLSTTNALSCPLVLLRSYLFIYHPGLSSLMLLMQFNKYRIDSCYDSTLFTSIYTHTDRDTETQRQIDTHTKIIRIC